MQINTHRTRFTSAQRHRCTRDVFARMGEALARHRAQFDAESVHRLRRILWGDAASVEEPLAIEQPS